MNSLIDGIIEYNRKNYSFTEFELAKLKYMIQTIFSETSKLIIMGIFFAIIGRFVEFSVVTVVLLCVRSYAGGLHFDTYNSCLFFTVSFFLLAVGLGGYVKMSSSFVVIAFVVSFLFNIAFAPVVSKNRPAYSKARLLAGKAISSVIIILIMIYLLSSKDGLYNNYIMWTVVLQCLQLAVAFGLRTIGKCDG